MKHVTILTGARIVSLAPGVIDTDMRSDLRAGDPGNFPEREAFVRIKESGALTSRLEAAKRVLAYLERDDICRSENAEVDPSGRSNLPRGTRCAGWV